MRWRFDLGQSTRRSEWPSIVPANRMSWALPGLSASRIDRPSLSHEFCSSSHRVTFRLVVVLVMHAPC